MFKAPFSFKGRIRRTEFGLSYIMYIVAATLVDYVSIYFNEYSDLVTIIFLLPLLWFFFAQGAKRCHDRDNSGFYQIIPFYFFWMIFASSDYGENKYGKNPKNEGNSDEIDQIGITIE